MCSACMTSSPPGSKSGRRAVAALLDVGRVGRADQHGAHLVAHGAQAPDQDAEADRIEAQLTDSAPRRSSHARRPRAASRAGGRGSTPAVRARRDPRPPRRRRARLAEPRMPRATLLRSAPRVSHARGRAVGGARLGLGCASSTRAKPIATSSIGRRVRRSRSGARARRQSALYEVARRWLQARLEPAARTTVLRSGARRSTRVSAVHSVCDRLDRRSGTASATSSRCEQVVRAQHHRARRVAARGGRQEAERREDPARARAKDATSSPSPPRAPPRASVRPRRTAAGRTPVDRLRG